MIILIDLSVIYLFIVGKTYFTEGMDLTLRHHNYQVANKLNHLFE